MTDGEQTSNHENTHVFTPIANELLEGAPQLVHVKVRGFVLCLTLSTLSPRIRRFRIVGVVERAAVRAVWVVTWKTTRIMGEPENEEPSYLVHGIPASAAKNAPNPPPRRPLPRPHHVRISLDSRRSCVEIRRWRGWPCRSPGVCVDSLSHRATPCLREEAYTGPFGDDCWRSAVSDGEQGVSASGPLGRRFYLRSTAHTVETWRRRSKSELVLLRCHLPRIEATSYKHKAFLSHVGLFVSKALAKQTYHIFHYHHHGTPISRFETSRLPNDLFYRPVMKKRRSPCSIASAKPKRQSWASAPVETNAPKWPAHAKACANANAGEAKSSARSAERCPKSRTVRPSLVFARARLTPATPRSGSDRLRGARYQRRDQQAVARETTLGEPDHRAGRCELQAECCHARRRWQGSARYQRIQVRPLFSPPRLASLTLFRYFGRAKDLPGVRELFQSRKKEEEEENQALAYYKKFMHQGPAYFGDLDETQSGDGLIEYEREAEEAEWREAQLRIREVLEIPADDPIPDLPRGSGQSTAATPSDSPPANASSSTNVAKRKADGDVSMANEDDPPPENAKRSKTDLAQQPVTSSPAPNSMQAHAQLAASYISFLSPEDLLPPKMPTREELEGVLLKLQKEALVNEYFGDSKL
jgi:hypothetical protein